MAELNTYGDLKKVIKAISLKQKGEKIGTVALDTVIGAIPGAGAAKTTFDFIKAAFSKPDTKKTNTWLDKLDIDDEMSAIVDDTVENGFLKTLTQTIDSEADDKPLEQDFNMNAKMVDYLKKTYGGRTVTGIKENKMKEFEMKDRFQQLAGIKEAEETALPNLDGIKTGDAKQAANFIRNNKQIQKLIGNINNPNEVNEFFSVLLGYMQDIKGVNKQNLKGLIDTKFK